MTSVDMSITRGKFTLSFKVERGNSQNGCDPCRLPAGTMPDLGSAGENRVELSGERPSRLDDTSAALPLASYETEEPYGEPGIRSLRVRKNSHTINFWTALDASARQDFISLADRRSFAAGAQLMCEGEQANHVAVITSGRVRIYVQENGRELALAERGPGELIGERAALRVSVRSATAKALDTVHALVVHTADFADFVTRHPAVLQILESQIYDRLTEGAATSINGDARRLCGQNCTIILTDITGFAAHVRNDLDRLLIRQVTADMTRAALAPFWETCSLADRGDGLLIVVPPTIPTTAVLGRLVNVLPIELRRHNSRHEAAAQVQLRVAADVGPVVEDGIGMSGEAIICAARMLDAPIFKRAIAEAGSPLGVIASDFVYRTAIRHGGESLDPSSYGMVRSKVKESRIAAWMCLVSPVLRRPRLAGPQVRGPGQRGAAVINRSEVGRGAGHGGSGPAAGGDQAEEEHGHAASCQDQPGRVVGWDEAGAEGPAMQAGGEDRAGDGDAEGLADLTAGRGDTGRHSRLGGRHAGHCGVGYRRVHQAGPDAEHHERA